MRRGLAWPAAMCVAVAGPLAAPAPGQAPAASAPEPARLDAARRLVAVMVPPAEHDRMARAMVRPIIADMRADAIRKVDDDDAVTDKAAARRIVDDFFAEQEAALSADMKAHMPETVEQMARAHARLLSVEQLKAIEAFYRTPAGAAFARATLQMSNDPEIASGQQTALTGSVERLIGRLDELDRRLGKGGQAGDD